jgi:outer membrane protein
MASPTDGESGHQGRWFGRVGVLDAIYYSGARIAVNGAVKPGATAAVSNDATVTVDIGYDLTRNIALMLMAGFPPKPKMTGEGTVASLDRLGEVRYGPVMLTATYRVRDWGAFHPYAGGGVGYAIILKERDASVLDLKVHNNWGLLLQAGAEYDLGQTWSLFADVKKLWLSVNADGVLAGGAPVAASVKLNPILISVGVKFRVD